MDKSILVSAAAGSGKTAVLIERIIGILLKGEANVDEMLVVTFTNAAAAEMRVKLARALKKAKMHDQLDKLYRAYISTFNRFAIRVIREFFYELDIEPNFSVCDEVEGTMMQAAAIDQLFEEAFEKDDLIEGGSFREFLRLYSSDRSEDTIKEQIIDSYSKLRSMPNYFEWAHNKLEESSYSLDSFRGSELEQSLVDECMSMLETVEEYVTKTQELFKTAGIEKMFEEKIGSDYTQIRDILENLRIKHEFSDELVEALVGVQFGSLAGIKKEYKEGYASIKEEISQLRDYYKKIYKEWVNAYLVPDINTRIEELVASSKYTNYFINLLEKFELRYEALKKEKGLLDFSDMEHNAARILSKPELADTMRKRFKYVFIDEYQDTNNIQEYLISRLSKEDNVFKVGDVKQSIYKFRQAEPAIFQRTHRQYSDASNKNATAIDLNMNFRSNANTIKYINEVFREIMEGYDINAELKPCPICEKDPYDFRPEVHLLIDSGDVEEDDSDTLVDSELRDLSKQEAEARYVAEQIQKLIGTKFYDSKNDVVRTVEPRDVVILLRSIKFRGDIYARELRSLNLQSHIEEESDYFDATEIRVALSLLSTIDNIKRDIPLIASLHSEAFGYTAEELATIRAESSSRKMPFWEAIEEYVDHGSDRALSERLAQTLAQIAKWREYSNMMALPDFIWKVLTESGYYLYAGAMYGGNRRQANLRSLVDRAGKYTDNAIASLTDYLRYLEVMRTKKCRSGQASMVSKDDNVVRISTIHKSKGLEYPFVIISGLGVRLVHDKLNKSLSFDSTLGIGMPYVSPDKKYWRSTILQQAIQNNARYEEDQEELRVLYVAMTRARNKLILVGITKDEEALFKGIEPGKNYLEIMRKVLSTTYNELYKSPLVRTAIRDKSAAVKSIIKTKDVKLSDAASKNYQEVERRLKYVYPNAEELELKAKYSVSELRRKELQVSLPDEEVVALWRNSDMQKRRASSADIGIAYHRIMEFIDFTRAMEPGYIEEAARYLLEKGAIAEDAYSEVELDRIKEFFNTDVGKRAMKAAKLGLLKKEKAFTLSRVRDGHEILVQGIIDCCFEEDGEYVLIDYKSSYYHKGIKDEYRTQIELYSEAIEKGTGKKLKEAHLYLFMGDVDKFVSFV